jgi:hypothetical protein
MQQQGTGLVPSAPLAVVSAMAASFLSLSPHLFMNSSQTNGLSGILAVPVLCMVVFGAAGRAEVTGPGASPGPLLWDTLAPLGDKLTPEDRSRWKAVPNDLLLLEKDPLRASSDPGYYGREYSFEGDAVVETPTLAAVFWSAKGCVSLYSKPESAGKDQPSAPARWRKIVDVSPLLPEGAPVVISRKEILQRANDEIVLQVAFTHPGSRQITGVFSFDKTGIVEVKPGENLKQIRLSSSIAYGVVPAFIGDDLIFGGSERPTNNPVAVPCENLFLGLLEGESQELVVTWPKGKQRMSLRFGEGQNTISSVDFDADGQSFYLAALSAPGIWHKETLTSDYLEKDVPIQWERPFPAKWKTQLYEEELKTTFAFRPFKGQIWRGIASSYEYPVWFNGEEAFYHLGKKVQPKDESIIYCLEGRNTPLTVLTPADILQQTLGRQAAAAILDFAGRSLRTHHRRGGEGVRRACTCGCTEAIQPVFKAGKEVSQQEYIRGALDDMVFFVNCHVERINEYRRFADDLLKQIQARRRSSPTLNPFLDSIEEIARQIPQECEVQKENMKTPEYMNDLLKQTLALASKQDTNNFKASGRLLQLWRDMGGAQDYVVAKCHAITRNVFQAAGHGCGPMPEAVPFAQEIRAACRKTLRNPDGYEIWADY